MENQINDGSQNTQQIGQNPVNQPVLTSEKPKANYLLIGGIILACFVIFGFGGYYLGNQSSSSQQTNNLDQSQSTPTENSQANNLTTSPSTDDRVKFREGEAISFAFFYPVGWSAYSTISDQSGESVEIFRLDPDPIWSFPHFIAFIEGEGRKSASSSDFDKAVENFQKEYNAKNLNWKTGNLKGSCFEYEYNSDMWGDVKGGIKCFVYIKSPEGRGFSGSYVLYSFDVFNGNKMIEKVDPNKSTIKFFIENLKTVSG